MKIAPVATPVAPQPQLETSATPDRRAAAIQAFQGDSPAKLAVSDTPIDPMVEKAKESIRKIKLRTQQSTNRPIQEIASESAPITTELQPNNPNIQIDNPQSTIPDASGEATEPEVSKPLSPQFAALARQKRALQVKESEIRQREEALKARESTDGTQDFNAKLKSNPLGVLEAAGVSYDDLTQAILQNPQNQELNALRQEIKALKEGFDKNLNDRDTQAEKQVLTDMRRETDRLVGQGEDYELVRETGSQSDVVRLIHETWKQTGEILDVSEAAKLVENELVSEIEKVAKLKKIQSKLTPAEQVTPTTPAVAPNQPRPMKTLTNRDTARPVMTRRDRAIAAFYKK